MSCVSARFIEGVGLDLGEVMCLHLIVPLHQNSNINNILKTLDKCRIHVIKDAGITKLVVISGNDYDNIYTLETMHLSDIKRTISNKTKNVGSAIIIRDRPDQGEFVDFGGRYTTEIQLWTEFQIMQKVEAYKTEPHA